MNILFRTIQERLRANPKGLYILFYTQMWELFGRYSITALLVLYLTKAFLLSDAKAFSIYSAFVALCYGSPILGGYLADRYLGSRHAILLGASCMLLGNILMIIPIESIVLLGLSISAIGCGFFLPSIPPLLSALYEKDEAKRDAGFTIYYLSTNLGGLIAPIIGGIVGVHYGYNYAFIFSSIGMLSGIIVFYFGEKHLKDYVRSASILEKHPAHSIANKQSLIYLLCALLIPIFYLIISKNVAGELLLLCTIISALIIIFSLAQHNTREKKHIIVILLSIFFVTVFEACLWQGGTTLNLFIDRNIDRYLLGIKLPTSAFYSLDPIFMFIVGPILAIMWTKLAQKNREPHASTKFALGLGLLGVGFLTFAVAAFQAKSSGTASLFYVVFAYFIFPIAELCIVPISLSLVTKLAPRKLESLFVSLWMLSTAAAGYFTGIISKFGNIDFKLDTTAGLEKAAGIYQSLFTSTAIGLIGCSLIVLLAVPLFKRLISDNSKLG